MRTPAVDELMRARVTGLFRHDERGRTVAVNQWDGGELPRFYLARTTRGNTWRIRADVPDDTAMALQRLAAEEPPLGSLEERPGHEAEYCRVLSGKAGSIETGTGLVYRVAAELTPACRPVVIDEANADLLRGGLEDWLPDVPHRQPMVAVIEDGRAVSICASVRITATTHEAGVETLVGYRRRGHAVDAVAGWAAEVRRRGVSMIFYSTSSENTASQAVAARLGLRLIGADFSVT
jgi:hypothetical protein